MGSFNPFKPVKKAFKSVAKEVGRVGDSVAKEAGRVGKSIDKEVRRNPGGWTGTIGTFGLNTTVNQVGKGLAAAFESMMPEMPGLPEMPEAPTYGQVQQNVRGSANVDLGGSESRRRTSGAAKGSRKLKVPLGGI